MAYISLDEANLADEHLCCAFSDAKHAKGTEDKRRWLRRRLREGLVFRKLDARAKVFIEYMPADKCWRPIVAPGWMAIHCLWVSGSYAKQGHGRALMQYCMDDTRKRGLAGVVVATGARKRPFLGDPKFFERFGFTPVHRAGEYVLWAWRIDAEASAPRFASSVQIDPGLEGELHARYTDQCPLNHHWARSMVDALHEAGCTAHLHRIGNARDARRVASPLGTFGLESDAGLVTHHLHTDASVNRLLRKRKAGS